MSDAASQDSTQKEFEDLFENAPCGYLTMLPNGRILRANAQLAAWMGYSAEQITSRRLHDLLTVGTRLFYETNFAPQLSLGDTCEEMSLDLKTASGEIMAVSASARVRKTSDGQAAVIRIALFKSAERRRYERQLVDARAKILEQARATQGLLANERETAELREQFIAVLGHDLRNPLAAVSGGIRLLRRDMSAERRDKLYGLLESSIARMASLIDNVLDFARGRLGAGIPLDLKTDVMLGSLLDQVVAELRLNYLDRKIESQFDLPGPIRCDPTRMSQLVSNLLGNALTHGAETEAVRIHANVSDEILVIWIANGGEPIPAAAIERLFHPFFRGEVRSSQQGLGLGLHIASEIAKAHGGTLEVASTKEETRFTFRMPIAAEN
ncbi:PAS domain-containing sensor histidine kinase [Acidisoma silvae]|uniref:histidine kinase n=1 Tax=Acidisoma silvae TaxID=2802396 RepID=A0A964E142_9PROT|nr:PAS domain-containing sensor histidine kinase [Acidisoma silvae]MCB8877966.1 PAS domain-containing sensor histidine kinase [Acidisoma silvae]